MPNLMTSYPQGLSDLFLAPMTGDLAMQQFNTSQRNNQINQESALQDMFMKNQMQPLKMESEAASAAATRAGIPLTEAQGRSAGAKADTDTRMQGLREKAELSKLATQVSEDEIKQLNSRVDKDLMSSDPRIRSAAEAIAKLSRDIIGEKEKQKAMMDRQVVLEQIKTNRSAGLESQRAATRMKLLEAKNTATTAKDPKTLEAETAALVAAARKEKDPQKKAMLMQEANEAVAALYAFKAGINQARKTGDPDLSKVGGIDTIQTPVAPQVFNNTPTAPAANAPTQTNYNNWTMDQWKSRYPNATDEQIRNAAKAKGIQIK